MPRGVGVRVPLSAQGFEDEQRKLLVFFCLVRTKGLAPPVAPLTTCLRWVVMYCVAMQLWVCAESNCLCKHRVTLNTHPQSTIASTSLPFSVTSRLLRTFESRAVQPQKFSANLFRSALALLNAVHVSCEARPCSSYYIYNTSKLFYRKINLDVSCIWSIFAVKN